MLRVSEQIKCESPIISVAMITYNHESYITQAIESVLMQQVAFEIEIVIGEDCSTDKTGEIVNHYASLYPIIIRTIDRQRNVGVSKNFSETLCLCRGKYIATMEGDDYWTDPLKLDKQVKFIEQNTDCVMCFHNSIIEKYGPDNRLVDRRPFYRTTPQSLLKFEDFAGGFYPHTSSCLIQNVKSNFIPLFDGTIPCFTKPLIYCVLAKGGFAAFMTDIMSVYRIHEGGIYSCIGSVRQLTMSNTGLLLCRKHFTVKTQRTIFTLQLIDNYISLLRIHIRDRNFLGLLIVVRAILQLLIAPPSYTAFRRVLERCMHYTSIKPKIS